MAENQGVAQGQENEMLQSSQGISGADWGYTAVSAYRDQISVIHEPFSNTWQVTGNFTVSGDMSNYVATELTSTYNAVMSSGGETISVAFNFTGIKSGGDIRVSWFTQKEISGFLKQNINPTGRMSFGSRDLELNKSLWSFRRLTPSHEFGHGLGLHHAPMHGSSIMSYHPGRSLQWKDAVNIRDNFRCNLFTLKGC